MFAAALDQGAAEGASVTIWLRAYGDMAGWINRVCARVRRLARARQVRFTAKAASELQALGLCLDHEDAVDVLAALSPTDVHERLRARDTGEWLYVFNPRIAGQSIYVKVALRAQCIVISFHDEGNAHEES